jgi:hypothetical protein
MSELVGLPSFRSVEVNFAEFGDAVTEGDLRKLAERPRIARLQCSIPVRGETWARIDEVFCPLRPDVEVRVYGHNGSICDLSFAARLRHVRRFAADCLMQATNVEAIAEMDLESLSLGIFELQTFDVLNRVSPRLTSLGLSATRSKKPRLDAIGRFGSLTSLYVEGHSQGIEAMGKLEHLDDLTLRSVTTPDLRYLAPLERLASLDIKLGGIRVFDGIAGKASIRYLELWQVRELQDVSVVAALPGLQNLFLQSLPHVREIPVGRSAVLRRAVLENLKGLRDLSDFESAPSLEQFALLDGVSQRPEQLLPVLRNPTLREACAYFGSGRKNNSFARLRDQHGKRDWAPGTPFDYR